MPRIIGIYEYRWYTPGSEPPISEDCVVVGGVSEQALRVRANSLHRAIVEAGEEVRLVDREKHAAHWGKYGPALPRTECRKVKIG